MGNFKHKDYGTSIPKADFYGSDMHEFEAKGEVAAGGTDGALTVIPLGSDGQVLTVDTSETGGIKWAASPGSYIEDDAYGSGWNGDATHAPSQNAVYDKVNSHDVGTMPHLVQDLDTAKTYRYGLQVQNGVTQFIYEEVI